MTQFTGCSERTFFLQFFLISLNSSSVLSQASKTVASVISRSLRQLVIVLFVIATRYYPLYVVAPCLSCVALPKGMHNMRSERIRRGEDDGEEGKRHLKREEYEHLCKFALENYAQICSAKFGTEVLLFLILGWNLCARSDTTAFIHSSHLDFIFENGYLLLPCSLSGIIKFSLVLCD